MATETTKDTITLEELEKKLTRAFREANESDIDNTEHTNSRLTAIGTIGQALVEVKKLQQEQKAFEKMPPKAA